MDDSTIQAWKNKGEENDVLVLWEWFWPHGPPGERVPLDHILRNSCPKRLDSRFLILDFFVRILHRMVIYAVYFIIGITPYWVISLILGFADGFRWAVVVFNRVVPAFCGISSCKYPVLPSLSAFYGFQFRKCHHSLLLNFFGNCFRLFVFTFFHGFTYFIYCVSISLDRYLFDLLMAF